MGNYTLLADEDCVFSNDIKRYDSFRSHLIYNILTNGSITLSDNQIMAAPNLRLLMRRDGVLRELVKNEYISLAVRNGPAGAAQRLDQVFEAFVAEGKMPAGFASLDDSPEIAFLDRQAKKIVWDFDVVRQNFTSGAKRIIFEQFERNRSVAPGYLPALSDIIATEEERDGGGLGRAFLKMRLPNILERYGILSEAEAGPLLRNCTEAVYLSNLPKTIGLTPIYADQHRDSFKLLRGHDYGLEPYGDSLDMRPRLAHDHFVAGLNQLDIDDVAAIHRSDAFRHFTRLGAAVDPIGAFDEMFVVFGELNRVIEDRIIERFRHLLGHSPAPDPRRLQRQYGTVFENGVTTIMDVLAFGLGALMPTIPGLISNYVVDAVRKKIQPDRPHVDPARRDLELERFRLYLARQQKDERINFEEQVSASTSFNREIIVG